MPRSVRKHFFRAVSGVGQSRFCPLLDRPVCATREPRSFTRLLRARLYARGLLGNPELWRIISSISPTRIRCSEHHRHCQDISAYLHETYNPPPPSAPFPVLHSSCALTHTTLGIPADPFVTRLVTRDDLTGACEEHGCKKVVSYPTRRIRQIESLIEHASDNLAET